MTNNDIFRRLRYSLKYNDTKMVEVFQLANLGVSKTKIVNCLKQEEDHGYENLTDFELASFLNGLIINLRGKQDNVQRESEKVLNNNIIFRKLKIALNLQAEDVINILALADFKISKHELSAFFRNPEHKHYRECKEQILRNFLQGVQIKLRPEEIRV